MPEWATPQLTITSVIDILAVAALIYNLALVLRGHRAMHVLNGIAILALVYGVAFWLKLELLRSVLATIAPYTAFALIVIFQAEIRRLLSRIGRIRWLGLGQQLERREMVDEIVLAVEHLTGARHGALIAIEREISLKQFIDGGVGLDAMISRDLLCSIFLPGTPLHDGAAIVQGDRIAAAACFLPLAPASGTARKLGTRHLAAVGVTEESDALAVVVSEETGQISFAARGELEQEVSLQRLRDLLTRYTGGRGEPAEREPAGDLERSGEEIPAIRHSDHP
jgi:diadenylate cyclase